MNGQQRAWLTSVQTTLNDAHMIVTDRVHSTDSREYAPDELVLLERIDMAIMHVVAMRAADKRFAEPLRVRETRL